MIDDICFFDKKKCLNIKNIFIHLTLEDGKDKTHNCCEECLFKIKKNNNLIEIENIETIREKITNLIDLINMIKNKSNLSRVIKEKDLLVSKLN